MTDTFLPPERYITLSSPFFSSKSHIFDGITLTKETAAFQLCDIYDPMLKGMIESDEDLRETCDVGVSISSVAFPPHPLQERDGWYSAHALERIKLVLRHKFFSLLQGYVATQEECEALLEEGAVGKKTQTTRVKKLKYGKHNMAKGALRPEDAAVCSTRSLSLAIIISFFFLILRLLDCKLLLNVMQGTYRRVGGRSWGIIRLRRNPDHNEETLECNVTFMT